MDLSVLCARVGKCRLVLNAKVSHVTEVYFFSFNRPSTDMNHPTLAWID